MIWVAWWQDRIQPIDSRLFGRFRGRALTTTSQPWPVTEVRSREVPYGHHAELFQEITDDINYNRTPACDRGSVISPYE